MKLEVQHRPRSRGVSQLMYVGDDDAVDSAVSSLQPWKIAGIAALIGAVASKKHRTALAAGGLLALAIGSGRWMA